MFYVFAEWGKIKTTLRDQDCLLLGIYLINPDETTKIRVVNSNLPTEATY